MQSQGNKLYQEGDYFAALTCYYKAISLDHAGKPTASLLNNISLCNINIGEYEAALVSADEAVALDPRNAKSHFRRATALMHIGKYAKAVTALEQALRLQPGDAAVRALLAKCKEEFQRANFVKALRAETSLSAWHTLDAALVESLELPAELYSGPLLPAVGECEKMHDLGVSEDFVKRVIEMFQEGRILPRKVLVQLVYLASLRLRMESSIVSVAVPPDGKIAVVGDVHGQFDDFLNILSMNGKFPSEKRWLLFNGDFVDRGTSSLEVLVSLLMLKIRFPSRVFLNRGNHEFEGVNEVYGFGAEVSKKYDDQVFRLISRKLFPMLPIAHVLNSTVFVTHGGIPPISTDLDIPTFNREFQRELLVKSCNLEDCDSSIKHLSTAIHLLWSDPDDSLSSGSEPSHRGIGVRFSKEVTDDFLRKNNFSLLLRSHEYCKEGYRFDHSGKCLTVFSAPNYTNAGDNDGSFVLFADYCKKYEIFQFKSKSSECQSVASVNLT